jgi:hypothetical protein
MIFINLNKVFDKISRNIMWWTLEMKRVTTRYVTLIKDMYINIVTCSEHVTTSSMYFLLR